MPTYQELKAENDKAFSNTPVTASNETVSAPLMGISTRDRGRSSLFRDLAPDYVYEGQTKSIASPFASDYFNTKVWGLDLGEVTDRHKNIYGGVNPFSKAADFENLRREEQSNFSAGLNLFNQYIGKTAINTIGGIIGGFYSLGSAIANQDSSLLFDNSVNRALDRGTNWIEENNSVFTSQRSRDNAPLGFFSFETIKDFTDAYSFISGAVASELIMGAVTGGATIAGLPGRAARGLGLLGKTQARLNKAIGLGNGVKKAGNFITRSEELGRLLSSTDPNDIRKLQTIARETGSTIEDLQKYRTSLDNFNSTIRTGRQIVTGTFWEAGLEARHAKDELLSSQLEKLEDFLNQNTTMSEEEKEAYRQNETKRITDIANTAGIWTFGLNTGVLGASNYIQFPTIFGKEALSSVNSMSGKLTRKGLSDYVKSGGKYTDILKTTARALKSPITEFTEETLQRAISTGSKSYYESMLGTRTSNGEIMPAVANLSDSVIKGLKDAYGTSEGLHEGVIGALVGAIGLPMLRKNKSGKLRPYMTGGIFESIRDNRQDNQNINNAIQELNLNEFDTLLAYNKDNAILSSIDSKKEDVANFNNNKFEVERLNDNKIFRHVKDRLDKGLESYMQEDINELKDMSLEEYKTRFQKPDTFTEQNKTKEVNDFSNKVAIYSNAYKKVYEGLQMNRINNNPMSKKLFDTLTYAIANEKIYGQRQREITDSLLSNSNVDLNYQELMQLAQLSDKYQNYEQSIKDYINSKEDEKLQNFENKKSNLSNKITKIKSRVSPQSRDLIDALVEDKESNTEYLANLISLQKELTSQTYQDLIAESEDIFAATKDISTLLEEIKNLDLNKDKLTKFSDNKSSVVREKKRQAPDIIQAIKNDIEKNSNKALETLRNKKDSVTQNEIEEYISLREKAQESIRKNSQDNRGSFLDMIDNSSEDIQELFDELTNITKHQVLALEIASNLYGIGNKAYEKIINASFQENISNIQQDSQLALMELLRQDDEDYMAELTANLKNSIDNLEEDLNEYKESLTEDAIKLIEQELEKAKDIHAALEKYLENEDSKEDIAKNTAQEDKDNQDKESLNSIEKNLNEEKQDKTIVDQAKEGIVNNEEFSNDKVILFNPKNIHTITPTSDTNANNIKAKIDNGDIKYNSAVVSDYLESSEQNPDFIGYLMDKNIDENYYKGKNKVIANPELIKQDINEMDKDVKTFITHFPMNTNIYNKEVNVFEGYQNFEIDEDDTVAHNFLYFAPNLESNILNDTVLFSFRQALLYNNYKNGSNELKMRLGNIVNGYLEKAGDLTNEVEEFALANDPDGNSLVNDISRITPQDILFGNQKGEYLDFNNNKVKLNRGSLINKTNARNARLYFRYKTINNQEIPVMLNRSRIKNNPVIFDEILYQIEQYLTEGKKPKTIIKLKNESLSFVKGKSYEDFFKTFLDESNSSDTSLNIDTFNINKKTKNIHFGKLNMPISSLQGFTDNRNLIVDTLGNMRYYMEKQSFRRADGSFNKDFLNFIIENKMINHSFNTKLNNDNIFLVNDREGKPFNKAIQIHILNSEPIERNKEPEDNLDKIERRLAEYNNLEALINAFNNIPENQKELYRDFFTNRKLDLEAKIKEKLQSKTTVEELTKTFNALNEEQKNVYGKYFIERKNELTANTSSEPTLDDLANKLIASTNTQQAQTQEKKKPNWNNAFEEETQYDFKPGSMAENLFNALNPDNFADTTTPPGLESAPLLDLESINTQSDPNPLTRQEKEYIKGSRVILRDALNDMEKSFVPYERTEISEFLKDFNINTHKKLIEAINIIYNDNSDQLNKMITFANKTYNPDKNTEIFNCK